MSRHVFAHILNVKLLAALLAPTQITLFPAYLHTIAHVVVESLHFKSYAVEHFMLGPHFIEMG